MVNMDIVNYFPSKFSFFAQFFVHVDLNDADQNKYVKEIHLFVYYVKNMILFRWKYMKKRAISLCLDFA